MIGKTIKSIEYTRWGDTGLIRFTDGSALQITGHSYEDVDLSFTELSPEQTRRRAARQQGEREATRVRRLWNPARRAYGRPSNSLLLIDDVMRERFVAVLQQEMRAAEESLRDDFNRCGFTAIL